jgi:ribosomal protein S27AE
MISGNVTVHYFEGETYAGSRQAHVPSQNLRTGTYSKFSPNRAFFCINCGQLWGRSIYEFTFDYTPFCDMKWVMYSIKCVKCGDGQFLEHEDIEYCDKSLLTRELLALIEGVKNENK